MISRYGQPIYVGWPEHHLEWVRSALTLDYRSRQEAFRDISQMTGRSLKAVRDRAKCIKGQEIRQAQAAQRNVMRLPAYWSMPPSSIPKPSLARLMGCK